MVVKEGMACPMPGSITPVTWPPVSRETLRELESLGYDYLYVGKGYYRVWVKRAHTFEYLDGDGINTLIETERKKAARAQRKREKLLTPKEERVARLQTSKGKKDKQEKKDATKDKATSKRRGKRTGLRRNKSQGKSGK